MNYLAIDASTEACSVALSKAGSITSKFELCPQSHSIVLLPMIDAVLKESEVSLSDLDGLIFGQGPGSFTGVRIGIGVAQGLAFSADLPVVGVSTLQTMAQLAWQKHQKKEVFAAIDARMSEIYAGHYKLSNNGIMEAIGQDVVVPPANVLEKLNSLHKECYGVGTGFDAYKDELSGLKEQLDSPEILYPDAIAMLEIGIDKFLQGLAVDAEHAQPVYVRDTVSWKKLPGRE